MATRLRRGWSIQLRVIGALIIRELTTRFGRENIGFLWIMAEPLLFAGLVGMVWQFMKGESEHGIGIVAFVVTGYLPLVLFRHSVSRAVGIFTANGSLMYHRQIKILDFIFVRFLIECVGHLMAYVFIAGVLLWLGLFPMPHDIGYVMLGWLVYSYFTFSLCLVLAPLSEGSEILEKFVPVTTYIMIPFSGTFNLVSWLTPELQRVMLWSPPVHAVEMMRFGVFGNAMVPHFELFYPLACSTVMTFIGLALCRRVRRSLVVE